MSCLVAMWRRLRAVVSRWRRSRSAQTSIETIRPPDNSLGLWDYKVVQMVTQRPADAANASRKLGGALSPEALRDQFPEHYGDVNGRKQINDFLNVLGNEGWELVQFQQVGDLPLMVFKRPKQLHATSSGAKAEVDAQTTHAG
jgi:hypothetical protein